jgi:hypothetical protein
MKDFFSKFINQLILIVVNGTIFFIFFAICVQCDYIVHDETKAAIWQDNIVPFIPELAFFYLFILIFVYSFFRKLSIFECFTAYLMVVYITTKLYVNAFDMVKYVSNNL